MTSNNAHPRKRLKTSDDGEDQSKIIIPTAVRSTHLQQPPQLDQSDDDDDFGEIPCDTVAALLLLKKEFPKIQGVVPFATKNQLYTVLKDKTITDRELDELKHANTLRIFKLATSNDEYAIMLTEDYVAAVMACKQASSSLVFEWFVNRVLPNCCETTIMHENLVKLLSKSSTQIVTEAHVGLLLNACCLTRHTSAVGQSCYMFAMPGAGPAVRGIVAGRKELLDSLSRRKHPEMLEAQLLKTKLKRSPLGVPWHLRDLLGAGLLIRIQTTVGPLIRVVKRG